MTTECVIRSPLLHTVREKTLRGERVSCDEGLLLLQSQEKEEIAAICHLADEMRKKRVGDEITFASTLMVYPTNLCELNCQFCSFYAKPGWEKAWFNTPAQIEEKIRHHPSLTEVHIVGGLWRDCNLGYYEELFGRIKNVNPDIHIKALTPVEYDFLAKLHKISIEEVFRRMIDWGLGSLPGGGAEILVEEVRKKIAPGKISSEEFLAIHELVHKLGLRSNITMLFGHVETEEHIIEHLRLVRDLQDKTGGFKTFIPLKFGEEDNALGKRKKQLHHKSLPLIYAVSRLMLDNIPNLKVLWNYVGIDEGLKLLQCGGNDFSSTNLEEKVIAMAGGTKVRMDVQSMEELIRSINRVPRLTNSREV
ncbi:MAG: CofH family radical SAM protein [Chlamydiales bacterium]